MREAQQTIPIGPADSRPDDGLTFAFRSLHERKDQMVVQLETQEATQLKSGIMWANVFRAPGEFGLQQMPVPAAGPGEAVIKVRRTTICGTDVHIVKGEYAVAPGLIIGHEATGVIHELGAGVEGYSVGQRVIAGAITPCGQCEFCLAGDRSQCGGALGGWKLGNTINGTQAEYVRIP